MQFGDDILERLEEEGSIPIKTDGGFEWTMTLEDCKGRYDLDMEALARSIPETTRVLCMHGTQDKVIPWLESQACASFITNSEFVTIDGEKADHNYTGVDEAKQMIEQVIQFVLG